MKKLSQEEAAKVLEDMKVKIEIPKAAVTQWKRNTALDMAVEALKYSEIPNSSDCISRQAAIDMFQHLAYDDWNQGASTTWANAYSEAAEMVRELPFAQLTLYGYPVEHLAMIATVLQKENLPPEKIADALTDIGRIVAIISDVFQETLRKAVEQCMT